MRSSSHRKDAQKFSFHLERELLLLRQELSTHHWKPDPYRYFKIFEPKERVISAASFRDRVVHHALIGLLEPIYERSFIFDSYATRKNKGTHAARSRAQHFLRKHTYFLKCDILQYFSSIDHDHLKNRLRLKIKDEDFLIPLFKIIDHAGDQGKGLPIGNLTSQFLANVYLDPFDYFIKEQLRAKAYLRYMDDFVLFHDRMASLKHWHKEIQDFLLRPLQLELKPQSTTFNTAHHGLSFLGARIYRSTVRIKRENLKRALKNIRHRTWQYHNGHITPEEYQQTLNSYTAYLESFDTFQLRKGILNQEK